MFSAHFKEEQMLFLLPGALRKPVMSRGERCWQVMQRLLRFMGLEEERYCVFRPVPGQPGRLSDVISEVMDRLERLGPNRKFREEL